MKIWFFFALPGGIVTGSVVAMTSISLLSMQLEIYSMTSVLMNICEGQIANFLFTIHIKHYIISQNHWEWKTS